MATFELRFRHTDLSPYYANPTCLQIASAMTSASSCEVGDLNLSTRSPSGWILFETYSSCAGQTSCSQLLTGKGLIFRGPRGADRRPIQSSRPRSKYTICVSSGTTLASCTNWNP